MASTKGLPTKLKMLRGNPSGHPERVNRNEPQPKDGFPIRPLWVTGTARSIWYEVKDAMKATGVITQADRMTLAMYCVLAADFIDLRKEGKRMAASDIAQIRAMIGLLGLSPSDRTRLHVEQPKDDQQAKADRFLA